MPRNTLHRSSNSTTSAPPVVRMQQQNQDHSPRSSSIMPRSVPNALDSTSQQTYDRVMQSSDASAPPSPTASRRPAPSYGPLGSELAARFQAQVPNERTSLLGSLQRSNSTASRSRVISRRNSQSSIRRPKHHSRVGSWGERLAQALKSSNSEQERPDTRGEHKHSIYSHDRVWYDQFTSTDWVHDSIADAHRIKALRSRKDFRGRVENFLDGSQGWLLSALVGCIVATIAYVVDVSEGPVFDIKDGYCSRAWYMSRQSCCIGRNCDTWRVWSDVFTIPGLSDKSTEYVVYVALVILLSTASCLLTLTTKTVIPSAYRISTLDENLGAPINTVFPTLDGAESPSSRQVLLEPGPPMVYYSAAGSGVAEVRVILSGFVLHGFLGVKTLVVKTIALILSVASGLSLGKEGPYVHIATCVGNIACRVSSKYNHNDGKRREVLSAAAASGVAVAFGAPIGGVLFSLEEVSYYFPPKTLFRTFFCCVTAALSLKFLNPYGTSKIAMFEVRYLRDWEFFEMGAFILLGMLGGAAGALFIKGSRLWARTFRHISVIKQYPVLEVVLVALVTGIIGFWNPYTKPAVAELLLALASPCGDGVAKEMGLCPSTNTEIWMVVRSLTIAFVVKGCLTIITFGVKLPAGIYVPSMVVGGLLGRIFGHLMQLLVLKYPTSPIFGTCAASPTGMTCITPGVYALIAAGSTMCGVTRLSVTLAVILFELTGSLDYVLPFSLAILVSKWTADAIEPLSIYDLLTNMNSYPFLDNKHKPVFTSDLADITPRVRKERIIDISSSPLVAAHSLRKKLEILHEAGELDGGLPIIRNDILVGLIPAPDLEFALDTLDNEDTSLCLMATVPDRSIEDDDVLEMSMGVNGRNPVVDPTDFTPYIDPAPVSLDLRSPMDLVYECFAKLGLRYICVLRDGQYAGLIHKKTFVKYMHEVEEKEKHT